MLGKCRHSGAGPRGRRAQATNMRCTQYLFPPRAFRLRAMLSARLMALVAVRPCCAPEVARPAMRSCTAVARSSSVSCAALPAAGGGSGGNGSLGRRGGGGRGDDKFGGSDGEGGALNSGRALFPSLLCAVATLLSSEHAVAKELPAGSRGAKESVPPLSVAVSSAVRAFR